MIITQLRKLVLPPLGLPRSVRVLIVRRRQTFENRFSNVCRLRTIKTRTERGRPGTEATEHPRTYVMRTRTACTAIMPRVCTAPSVHCPGSSCQACPASKRVFYGWRRRRGREGMEGGGEAVIPARIPSLCLFWWGCWSHWESLNFSPRERGKCRLCLL